MSAITQKEPAVIIGLIGGAIIAALEVLGPELFPDLQLVAIQTVQAIVAVLTVLAIRFKVYSPATVEALTTPSVEAGDGPADVT